MQETRPTELPRTGSGMRTLLLLGLATTLAGLALLGGGAGKHGRAHI